VTNTICACEVVARARAAGAHVGFEAITRMAIMRSRDSERRDPATYEE